MPEGTSVWKDAGKTYGANMAENYERYFVPVVPAPLAADLIDAASLRAGERVVDVACGTGIAARTASEIVGPDRVTGVDPNPGMLAVARSVAPSIEWHEGSAEALPLDDDAYDVLLCSLGLQFFGDRAAALSQMRRVVKPGGRFIVNALGPTPPTFEVFADALAKHINPGLAGFVHAVFSLHDPSELEGLFTEAGLRDVTVTSTTKTLPGPAPREFLWQYLHSTPLAGAVAQADDESLQALERDVVEQWQPFARDDGMVQEVDVHTATARK